MSSCKHLAGTPKKPKLRFPEITHLEAALGYLAFLAEPGASNWTTDTRVQGSEPVDASDWNNTWARKALADFLAELDTITHKILRRASTGPPSEKEQTRENTITSYERRHGVCGKCGSGSARGARYCSRCGEPIRRTGT